MAESSVPNLDIGAAGWAFIGVIARDLVARLVLVGRHFQCNARLDVS